MKNSTELFKKAVSFHSEEKIDKQANKATPRGENKSIKDFDDQRYWFPVM